MKFSDARKHIGNKIPIQLQLSYISDEGAKVVRAMTIHVDVTDDVKKVEKSTIIIFLFSNKILFLIDMQFISRRGSMHYGKLCASNQSEHENQF